MLKRLVDWLIAYAKRTPYFPLPGYMNRFWIIPFGSLHKGEDQVGCYDAVWYRNPLVWLCQRFDVAVRIHEILRSDIGRQFHDHPWAYITVILKGGYTEVTPIFEGGIYKGERTRWYGPGSILFRRANSWHRLELSTDPAFDIYNGIRPRQEFERTCTTLFITFKYQQKWGYLVEPRFKKHYKEVHAAAAKKLPELR